MLERLVERTHARFGVAVLIDCHSMPASVRIGETGLRPDFIVGDRFGTSCSGALTEHAIGALSAMGYTVAHNKPYAGGYITERYGRPAADSMPCRSRSIAGSISTRPRWQARVDLPRWPRI
jgi:N-formylglutamate amidohydrolase